MGTVDRVLPWRRHHHAPVEEIDPLISSYRHYHPKASIALVSRAYEVAARAHGPQRRSSGEAYINHPIAVARIVAGLGLDDVSVAAALLHDSVEDTDMTLADVEAGFGPEVARLVDGVTKLERMHFDSKEAQQAATMRKMLVSVAKDIRVLIIKLADRLHNMRTIAGMPYEKQKRIAYETLDIYAPLAHRLGISELKQQLEDLAFAAIHPRRFAELDHLVACRSPERDVFLARVVADIRTQLSSLNIHADVSGRGKHLWSINEKMTLKNVGFDAIFDLVAVRVVTDTAKDAYAALGCIHGRWNPVQGRFKDYIAMPKFNLYQSLHTTVVGPDGKTVEIQIRTREMHQRAEWGIAAHWAYKEGGPLDLDWLNRITDLQFDPSDPNQYLEGLRIDLSQDEVFVFTPKGKVVTLPYGSTPVDFAYAIHTEIGHACIGAKVNGQLATLNRELVSGDSCEIYTSRSGSGGPSREWLEFVASPRARVKIKQWFSRERREDPLDMGRDELVVELEAEELPGRELLTSAELAAEAVDLGYGSIDALLAAIGNHEVTGRFVAQRVRETIMAASIGADTHRHGSSTRDRPGRRRNVGVHVEGLDDVPVRLSRCCTPVPGDPIIGLVTRGRGVSVHRTDCANTAEFADRQAARVVEAEWDESLGQREFRVNLEVRAIDRKHLLSQVANAISSLDVNILTSSTHTGNEQDVRMRFEVTIGGQEHLDAVLRSLGQLDGVYSAYRIVPGSPPLDSD